MFHKNRSIILPKRTTDQTNQVNYVFVSKLCTYILIEFDTGVCAKMPSLLKSCNAITYLFFLTFTQLIESFFERHEISNSFGQYINRFVLQFTLGALDFSKLRHIGIRNKSSKLCVQSSQKKERSTHLANQPTSQPKKTNKQRNLETCQIYNFTGKKKCKRCTFICQRRQNVVSIARKITLIINDVTAENEAAAPAIVTVDCTSQYLLSGALVPLKICRENTLVQNVWVFLTTVALETTVTVGEIIAVYNEW